MRQIFLLLALALSVSCRYRANAQVFLEERFTGGRLPDGWISQDISGNGVRWEGCSSPGNCGLSELPEVLAHFGSTSAADGFAVANSDAAGNLPNDGHISRLTSTPIDCSDKGRVFLQFQTAIGTYSLNAADNALLRIMTNTGNQTYHPFSMLEKSGSFQVAPLKELARGKAYYITLDISEIAAGKPEVYLEWEWRGNYEFAWLIDDLLLSTENPARPEGAVYFESFSNGSNGWEAYAISADSLWAWAPAGDVGNGYALTIPNPKRDAFIHSLTAADGAMAFNADYYNTRGMLPGQGFSPKFFVCELISPVIDLSGAGQPLALQFTQLGWLGNLANAAPQTQEGARFITSFAYSTNGGANWSEPVNVNPYQTPGTSFNINSLTAFNNTVYFALPDVEGSSEFRIRFTWAADFFFWVIDDIALLERPVRDMKANRNFFAIMPNTITPKSQLQDETLLCDMINIGAEDCRDVRLEAVIRKKDSGRITYADTLSYESIPVDSLVENEFFNRKLEAQAIMETGEYDAIYAVGHSQADSRPQDDTVRWRFFVSDHTFAKELGPTRDIAPSETPSYTYGNVFYVPNGAGFYACQVSFGVANAAQLANAGEEATIFLHEWDGDLNADGLANPEEYRIKAFNSHIFEASDGTGLITLPISIQNKGVALEDGKYYLLVVQYESFFLNCFMQASDTIDYQATWFVNDSLGHQQYASVLDIGNTGTFNTIGFGYDIVPVVRMHLGADEDCTLVLTKEQRRVEKMHLFPNPAGERARLQLDGSRTYSGASIVVTSISGKPALSRQLGQVQQESIDLDVSRLPPGMYVVKFIAQGYTGVGKVVVQR